MSDESPNPNLQAGHHSTAAGDIHVNGSIEGSLIIGSNNVVGYTTEQVSVLIKEISNTFQPKSFDGRSPYKGLDYFEEEDADLFFGREKLVENLVSRITQSQTLFVTGPSGSGKSSLVRAGLIHALKQGCLKDSEHWLYTMMRPGRDPFEAMAGAFSRLKSPDLGDYFLQNVSKPDTLHKCAESMLSERHDQRLVILMDQFEEVFTQISKDKAETFINLLDHAVNTENGRVILLFAMRSDFISNCALYPRLNALYNRQNIQIGGMQPKELVSAIAQPALRVGLRIDPDLIAQIINDMQGEPGALPLMQFALKDLFDTQQAKGSLIQLTLSDYLLHGGINEALQRHADDSFNRLDGHEQELARSIFKGLIEIGRGTQDTRRTAIINEFLPADVKSEDVEVVVRKLADARLVTTDEIKGKETVTLSHEKLIDAWPWLKKLINENRELIALQNEIAADAKEWEEHRRDASYLYSGARLANVNEQLTANRLDLNGSSLAYVRAGQARQRRNRLTIIGAISVIFALLMLAVIVYSSQADQYAQLAQQKDETAKTAQAASTQAIAQQATAEAASTLAVERAEEAQRQTRLARIGELSAQSVALRDKEPQLSLLLAVEANNGSLLTARSHETLLENVLLHPQLHAYLNGHTGIVMSVAFSPDGKTLASDSWDKTIRLWDVATSQPIGQPLTGHTDYVASVAFSPDGKTLASGSWDKTIRLWDVATGKSISQPLTGHTDDVGSVAFSPDGKTLASGSWDKTIRLWDVATGQPIGQPLTGHTEAVLSVAFSPDSKTLASGSWDHTIRLWDVQTRKPIGKPLEEHIAVVSSVSFSPDGKTLASGSSDKSIILWDVATGQPIGKPLIGHTANVNSLAFSPDGRRLASGSDDKTIIIWNVAEGKSVGERLTGHTGAVFSVAFNPDGKHLASGGVDPSIIFWNFEPGEPIGQPLTGQISSVASVAFSPDSKILAVGHDFFDHTIVLWDVATGQLIGQPLIGHTAAVLSVAFSPYGKTLASGSWDKTIRLWNVATGQPIGQPFIGHTDGVMSMAFSPDGKTLASGSWDNTIRLWNVATGQPIGQPLTGHTLPVTSVAFSPDGQTLASGSRDRTVRLWDVGTGKPIGKPLTGSEAEINSLAFSLDGKTLGAGNDFHSTDLWDVATGDWIGQLNTGHTDHITSVAFSPDGQILASGSDDHSILLWDIGTGKPIGQPLIGHTLDITSLAFSPDGKTLASGSHDNSVILWHVDPQSLIEISCRRANRNFTSTEWKRYFPGEKYRTTCEQFPLEKQ
jgi:WD40 repeat protein